MRINRRHFLKGTGALGLTGLATGLGTGLANFPAYVADTSGYKALVCLFLLGGNDGHDTLLPFDQTSYDRYADIRAPLLSQYEALGGVSSRSRERLLELTPSNANDFGTRRFALPPELSGIKSMFDNGMAAIVGNVGPLLQATDREGFTSETIPLPRRLFSHNDQQSTWQSSQTEGAQTGWGGLFGDAAFTSGAAQDPDFVTISSFSNEVFVTGETVAPYQLPINGPIQINALEFFEEQADLGQSTVAADILRRHFKAMDFTRSNLFEQAFAAEMENSLVINDRIVEARATATPLSTTFPQSFIGAQLQSVAETISIRDALFTSRQVFYIGLGGFDTHDNQATSLPALHAEIDTAITAFYQALGELGLVNNVTLFTASDFGRTLAINGDGTDHGWGSHHFVIGGAVNGNRIYGDIPPYDFDHSQDAGNGRLIPTTSVEQYAAPLGRWFGLSEGELNIALPNLGNFNGPTINFI
jgi:uncharacterized protein (DUF1501 family)